jgi:hypothetical protein
LACLIHQGCALFGITRPVAVQVEYLSLLRMAGLFEAWCGKLGIVEAGVMMLKNMPHVGLDIIEIERFVERANRL